MKKALLVGVNKYQNPKYNKKLKHCVSDVRKMHNMLTATGFSDVRCLLNKSATSANLSSVLTDMVNNSKGGDSLLFYFTGHGLQLKDISGDEKDGLDEALLTYDYNIRNAFTDDKLADCLDGLHKEVKFTLIADACHSGSMIDAIYGQKPVDTLKASYLPVKRYVSLSACIQSKIAYESRSGGILTRALVSAWKAKKPKNKTWKAVFPKIENFVRKATNGRQSPILAVSQDSLRELKMFA